MQLAALAPNFVIQEMSLGIHYNTSEHDLLTYLKNPDVFRVQDGMVAVLEGDPAVAKKYMLAAKQQDPSLPIDANGKWTSVTPQPNELILWIAQYFIAGGNQVGAFDFNAAPRLLGYVVTKLRDSRRSQTVTDRRYSIAIIPAWAKR